MVRGWPSTDGCNGPLSPHPQCSAGPPPLSATPVPSANQSSAMRSAPSRGTSAAPALPRAARPSSGAGRMGHGSPPSSPVAPVSAGFPHLPPASVGVFPSPGASRVPPRPGSAPRRLSESPGQKPPPPWVLEPPRIEPVPRHQRRHRRVAESRHWVSASLLVLYLYKEILISKDSLERNRQRLKT